MDKQRIQPSEKIRKEIEALIGGMKKDENFYEDPMTALLNKAKTLIVQEMLEKEAGEHLGRDYYDHDPDTAQTNGYRNGYEPRKLKTPEGPLELRIPQIRESNTPYRSKIKSFFQTNSEVLTKLALEMYVRGLSTRDIEDALHVMTGDKLLSSGSISNITEVLWEDYKRFCERDLSNYEIIYIAVDAVYEAVRAYVKSKEAILVAYGITSDGRKILLHMELGNRESYEFCKEFLRNMIKRKLNVPISITSDGAPGMTKAIDEVFPHSLRLRCWMHKMQNLCSKLPLEIWEQVKPEIQAIRDSLSYDEGEERLHSTVNKYKQDFPSFADCLLDDYEALLNVLHLPRRHQTNVRTTNLVERVFVEERRRTKIIPQFLTEKSCLKLVFSVLYRASLKWRRIVITDFETKQISKLRKRLGIELGTTKTTNREEAFSNA